MALPGTANTALTASTWTAVSVPLGARSAYIQVVDATGARVSWKLSFASGGTNPITVGAAGIDVPIPAHATVYAYTTTASTTAEVLAS